MTNNFFAWAVVLFTSISLVLLIPDIFPVCGVCRSRKLRARFKFIEDSKTAVCRKCSEHFNIDTAADLLLYKTAKMKALNKLR